MMKFEKILSLIEQEMKEICPKENLPLPASPIQVSEVENYFKEKFGRNLPDSYKYFLFRCNGLNWDGIYFNSTEPILEKNSKRVIIPSIIDDSEEKGDWLSGKGNFCFIGFNELDVFVYNFSEELFQSYSFSEDLYLSTGSFDEFFYKIFQNRMGLPLPG
jgi:hypothetical protein